MVQAVFALVGIVLLVLAAVGVSAGRVSLTLLAAACLAVALFEGPLAVLVHRIGG